MKKFVGYFIIILLFVGTGLGIFFGIEYAKNEKYIQENSATLEQVYELQQELDLIQGRLENALEQNELDYETITSLSKELSQATDDLQECQSQLTTTTNNLNQALEQNKIDAEAIAGYLDDIAELNGTIANLSTQITNLNNQIKYYQELLEAYEDSEKLIVTFYLVENGEQTPYDVQVVNENDYVNQVLEPTLQNKYFAGWSLTSDGSDMIEDLTSIQVTENISIFGIVKNIYSINFMVENESYLTQSVIEGNYISLPEEPTPNQDGYIFAGWQLEGEDVDVQTIIPDSDLVFTAKIEMGSGYFDLSGNLVYDWEELKTNEYIYSATSSSNYLNADKTNFLNLPNGQLIIDDEVDRLQQQCFQNMTNLIKVKIPKDTDISAMAFSGCSNLESVEIGEGCVFNGSAYACFADCLNLKSIVLPDSITNVPSMCFLGCESLEEVKLSNNTTIISSMAFSECLSLTSLVIPESVNKIEQGAIPSNCENLTDVIFENADGQRWQLVDDDTDEPIITRNVLDSQSNRQAFLTYPNAYWIRYL